MKDLAAPTITHRFIVPLLLSVALLAAGRAGAVGPVLSANPRPLVEVRLPKHATGPLPTVLLQHGWGGRPESYSTLTRDLVAKGFAVALVRQPNNLEYDPHIWRGNVSKAIDLLERGNHDPSSSFAGKLDLRRLGIVGHSLGGATAIAAAADDPRIKSAVALAPGTTFLYRGSLLHDAARVGQAKVPLLVMAGTYDMFASPFLFSDPIVAACPGSTELKLRGGTHFGFSDKGITPFVPTWFGPLRIGMRAEDQRRVADERTAEWFKKTLH